MSIFLAARASVCVVAFLLLSLPCAFAYCVFGSSPKPFQRGSFCPPFCLPSRQVALSLCVYACFMFKSLTFWALVTLIAVCRHIRGTKQATYIGVKGKVQCTLLQALRLCTGRTARRGSRSIAVLSLDHGTRRGRRVRVTPRPLFTPGKDPVLIVQEAG